MEGLKPNFLFKVLKHAGAPQQNTWHEKEGRDGGALPSSDSGPGHGVGCHSQARKRQACRGSAEGRQFTKPALHRSQRYAMIVDAGGPGSHDVATV